MNEFEDEEENAKPKFRFFGWSVWQISSLIFAVFVIITWPIPAGENPVLTSVMDVTNRGDYTYVKVKEGILSTSKDECVLLKPNDTVQLYEYKYIFSSETQYKIDKCDLTKR